MNDSKWSGAEKKLAQRVYEEARVAELAETLAEFKALVAAATSVDEMWPLEGHLRNRRLALDEKYQYRYSRLPLLFAQLIREGRVAPARLEGLSQKKKLDEILQMASR
jgi:hypothetical protein